MENLVLIGHTRKSYGINGEMKLHVDKAYLEDIPILKIVFIKINGKHIPYFIESVRYVNALLIKLEDINTPEDTIHLASREIYARQEDLLPDEDRTFEVETLEFEKYAGYLILNAENQEEIGIIKKVVEYPQQEMAIVNYNDREILIPLNHALIDSIDDLSKMMYLNLPEGLLDL